MAKRGRKKGFKPTEKQLEALRAGGKPITRDLALLGSQKSAEIRKARAAARDRRKYAKSKKAVRVMAFDGVPFSLSLTGYETGSDLLNAENDLKRAFRALSMLTVEELAKVFEAVKQNDDGGK